MNLIRPIIVAVILFSVSACSTKQPRPEPDERTFYEGNLAIHTFRDGWTLTAGLGSDGSKSIYLWREATQPTGFGSTVEPQTSFASILDGVAEIAATERGVATLAKEKDAVANGRPAPPSLPPDVPILTIGCIDHKTYVFIDVNNPGDPEGSGYARTVGIVLDRGQRSAERWTATKTGRAVFAPNPLAIARRIAGARSLLVEFKPFDRPPAQLTFNISGLSAHIMQVAQACGWEYKADGAR